MDISPYSVKSYFVLTEQVFFLSLFYYISGLRYLIPFIKFNQYQEHLLRGVSFDILGSCSSITIINIFYLILYFLGICWPLPSLPRDLLFFSKLEVKESLILLVLFLSFG